jgi:hypothetical protein
MVLFLSRLSGFCSGEGSRLIIALKTIRQPGPLLTRDGVQSFSFGRDELVILKINPDNKYVKTHYLWAITWNR